MIEISDKFTDEELKTLSLQGATSLPPQNTRLDEAELTNQQRDTFIKVVKILIENKKYNEIVNIHANPSRDMHSRNMATGQISRTGAQRFLPWHRVYLLEFEKILQEEDPSVTIPYWNWTKNRKFPDWLAQFTPQNLVKRDGTPYSVSRKIGETTLPDPSAIKDGMRTHTMFTNFTLFLEGVEPRGAHNQVHAYVGGTMNTMYSPADPIFWLHHAECDRLWHVWQRTNPNKHATLGGTSIVMDPWPYRYNDVAEIENLNYQYSSTDIG